MSEIRRDPAKAAAGVRECADLICSVLPPPAEWNAAVEHSTANPTHILGPYGDADGVVHMCCEGDGDPYEPSNCDFSTSGG
jgi:hypothetical protein